MKHRQLVACLAGMALLAGCGREGETPPGAANVAAFWFDSFLTNKDCDRSAYRAARSEEFYPRSEALRAAMRKPHNEKTYEDVKQIDNHFYERAYITYCQGSISDVADLCKSLSPPKFGEHSESYTRDLRLGAEGTCRYAYEVSEEDPDPGVTAALAEAYWKRFIRFLPSAVGLGMSQDSYSTSDQESIDRLVYYSYRARQEGHPSGHSLYCKSVFVTESSSYYASALESCRAAWQEHKEAEAASMIAYSYEKGLVGRRSLDDALIWYREAQAAGLDVSEKIAALERERASQVRDTSQSSNNVGALILGGFCLLWEFCRNTVTEKVIDSAFDN